MYLEFNKGDIKSNELYISTVIEKMYISQRSEKLEAKAWAHNGKLQNGVECINKEKTVISLQGLQFALLRNPDEGASSDRHAAAYLPFTTPPYRRRALVACTYITTTTTMRNKQLKSSQPWYII